MGQLSLSAIPRLAHSQSSCQALNRTLNKCINDIFHNCGNCDMHALNTTSTENPRLIEDREWGILKMYGMLQPPPSPSPLHVLYSSSRFISDQFRPSINRLKKDSNTDDIHQRYCGSLRNMWYKHNNPWKSCILYGLDTAHLTDLVYDHLILKCPCNISAL